MLTRIYGKIQFECDTCGAVLDTETKNFEEALMMMRASNWRAEKVRNVWIHHCEACDCVFTGDWLLP